VLRDAILNILIYAPLGFAAAATFRRKQSRLAAAVSAAVFGFLFSVSMELLQVYVPGRDASLADVLTNTIGSAIGAVLAFFLEGHLRRIGERRPSQFRSAAVLLLLVWAVAQLYPFFPDIGIWHLRQEFVLLLHNPRFSLVETAGDCAEWFAVGLALNTVFAHMRTSWLAVAMLCVPAQLMIADRALTAPEIAGALIALTLWHFVRVESRPRWCAWMLGFAILLRQLEPFYFLAVPQPFSWVPFQATLLADRLDAAVVIARKTFDYGAAIWALRYAGVPLVWAGLAIAALLGATEAIQTYLPGRSPEITDPLLALLLTLVLRALSGRANRNA
jgi:VanZ family protein